MSGELDKYFLHVRVQSYSGPNGVDTGQMILHMDPRRCRDDIWCYSLVAMPEIDLSRAYIRVKVGDEWWSGWTTCTSWANVGETGHDAWRFTLVRTGFTEFWKEPEPFILTEALMESRWNTYRTLGGQITTGVIPKCVTPGLRWPTITPA